MFFLICTKSLIEDRRQNLISYKYKILLNEIIQVMFDTFIQKNKKSHVTDGSNCTTPIKGQSI